MKRTITNTELVAVAEKSADALTERRVLAAALLDPGIRQRLTLLEAKAVETSPLPTLTVAQQAAFQERLATVARRVGREYAERATAHQEPRPGWLDRLEGTVRRFLTPDPHRFNLPALAPSLAATAVPLRVQREVIDFGTIHLEVHQLPDSGRLRFLVDASAEPGFLFTEGGSVVLALQEEGSLEPKLLKVPLNQQGRGILEQEPLPIQQGMELIGVALVTE